MHYDQEHLFSYLVEFQREIGNEGIEVTESDLLETWRLAREETGYFK